MTLLHALADAARAMNPLEALATAMGVANIVLLVRRSVWNYPFGLLMVALYAVIFFGARLYSDALLQGFFFAIQLYGWWAWTRAGEIGGGVRVATLTNPARIAWAAVIVLVSLAWGTMMQSLVRPAAPYWDGTIAVASVAAQILLARRRIENWVLWILVDVAAIGLYAVKGLPLTACLYALFLALSVIGLVEWRRVLAREGVAA